MRTHCPVCYGKGTIDNPEYIGRMMMYSGPNGETCPQMTCPNCQGEKFIGTPDVRNPLIPQP